MGSEWTVEKVWCVEAIPAPGADEVRKRVRTEHVERLVSLIATGRIIEAGAFEDGSAIIILRASGEREALTLCMDDPYTVHGVWVSLNVRPFKRLTAGPDRQEGAIEPAPEGPNS